MYFFLFVLIYSYLQYCVRLLFFLIIFHDRLLQDIEHSSLYYAVNPGCLSAVSQFVNPILLVCPSFSLPVFPCLNRGEADHWGLLGSQNQLTSPGQLDQNLTLGPCRLSDYPRVGTSK